MNKKKIIFSVIAFISALFISLLFFFPINPMVSKIIRDTAESRKLDLRYDDINISPFGASVSNLKTGKLVVDNIRLKYNPIGLIFKRADFEAESQAFSVKGRLSGGVIKADAKGYMAGISGMAGYTGSGSLTGNLEYDMKNKKGALILNGGPVTFNHPMMILQADSLEGSAEIDGGTVTVSKLEAKGKNSLNAGGTIALNNNKIDQSVINMSGSANMNNYKMDFQINGPVKSPKFLIK